MTQFYSRAGNVPHIPDNLTIPQFILDGDHSTRPTRQPGVPWLIEDGTGKSVGLKELRERTFGLANALNKRYNIHEDDVALIYSPNHLDYPVVIWAIHRLGGIISGANPNFTVEELVYQLNETKSKIMVVHPDVLNTALSAARIANIPAENVVLLDRTTFSDGSFDPNQTTVGSLIKAGLNMKPTFVERRLKPGEARTKLAFLSFSSGTTGKPKAVALPHIAPIANVIQMAAHNKVNEEYTVWEGRRYRPGDVAIGVVPFYHIYGLVVNLHFILFCAMSVVVIPKFNFIDMLNSIVRHRITHLLIVPPQAVLLCKHPDVKKYDLSVVRVIVLGGAPLSRQVNQQLIDLFPDAHIGQAYGMTEVCGVASVWPLNQKRGTFNSGGQLLPGVEAKVLRVDGSLAGCNEPGEIILKSPANALGYFNNKQATQDSFVDGWLRTGDEVAIDANQEIIVVDRIKEIMKVKGFQVAPAELEDCILQHPEVADVCVIGIPDDYSGEVPLAFVVPKQTKTALNDLKASIMKHVADNKVAYKRLAGGVEFIDIIPKNPSGKLLRRLLREKAKDLVASRARL